MGVTICGLVNSRRMVTGRLNHLNNENNEELAIT